VAARRTRARACRAVDGVLVVQVVKADDERPATAAAIDGDLLIVHAPPRQVTSLRLLHPQAAGSRTAEQWRFRGEELGSPQVLPVANQDLEVRQSAAFPLARKLLATRGSSLQGKCPLSLSELADVESLITATKQDIRSLFELGSSLQTITAILP
jgi:hypothetical protein